MNPIQESKQELEAAIRYSENAISKAKQTIESMATHQEQTGREAALQEERDMLEKNVKYLRDENERLKREKEASSGPCGCQAYRDLEEARGPAEGEVELLQRTIADLEAQVNALEQPEQPTMPVIPKDVAIAIFREGMQHGVESACTEIEGQTKINIDESEYVGDFHISFDRDIDLDDHLELDWMRDKCGDYSEEFVIDALGNLCADKEFECRIYGIDDQEKITQALDDACGVRRKAAALLGITERHLYRLKNTTSND